MIEKVTKARPYAKAIFNIAKSTGGFTEWLQTLKILAEISTHPEVQRILRDSTISPEQIAQMVEEIFPLNLNNEGKNLIQLLALKRRLSVLPEIVSSYEKLCDENKQILPVELLSVIPLTKTQKEEFSVVLSKHFGKKVEMNNQIDPGLLGGFWIKAGDQVIDGSIRGHLEQLKATMGE